MFRRTKVFIVLGLIQAFFLSLVIAAVGMLTAFQLGSEKSADDDEKPKRK